MEIRLEPNDLLKSSDLLEDEAVTELVREYEGTTSELTNKSR
jgi:hypothetical protein